MKRKKKDHKSISWLKGEADRVFSLWIRKRDKNTCFTCGAKGKYMQCGHFVPRQHNSLRYSEINCHCQCVACNVFKKGNMDEYADRLEDKYGFGIIQKLKETKHKIKQFKSSDLEEIIKKYE